MQGPVTTTPGARSRPYHTGEHTIAIKVDTQPYIARWGHPPRQPRTTRQSLWAFRIDADAQPRYIRACYRDALAQALAWAIHTVTVLP